MSLRDTFAAIASWPPEQALTYFEAALQDPFYEIQREAYRLLTDPNGLNRPDLVVLHFDTLVPEVKSRLKEARTFFLDLGRRLIRGPSEHARRSAYKMLGEIGGADVARDLAMGVDDASTLIRFNIAESLEKIAINYHYHLLNFQVRKDPQSRQFIDANRKAMFDALGMLLKTWPLHRKDIFLNVAVESGDEAYPLVKDIVLHHVGGPLWNAFIESMQASSSDAMCQVLFRLYLEGPGKFRDAAVAVMRHRKDAKFPAAIAEHLVHSPAERLGRLRALRELPFWGAVEANPQLTPAVVIPLLDFVSSSEVPVKERDLAIKSQLANRHPQVRVHVLRTFHRLKVAHTGELARECLEDATDEVKLVAAKLVAELLPSQKPRLLAPLLDSGSDEVRRVVLREVADLNVSRYAGAFAAPDPASRQLAERIAARIDPSVVDRLVEAVIALDPIRRLQALRLAEAGRSEREIQPLVVEILQDDGSPLRPLLVQLLAFSGNRPGLRLILELLAGRDLHLSARIVEMMQELHDVRLAALFLPFLVDRDLRVRGAAGRTVAAFGTHEANLLLAPLVAMGDDRLRLAAVTAITEMKLDGGRDLLASRLEIEANPQIRETIRRAMTEWI